MSPTARPRPCEYVTVISNLPEIELRFHGLPARSQAVSKNGTTNTKDERAKDLKGHRSEIRQERLSKTTNLPNRRYPETHPNPVLPKNNLHIVNATITCSA
jgi:hypothetical protein